MDFLPTAWQRSVRTKARSVHFAPWVYLNGAFLFRPGATILSQDTQNLPISTASARPLRDDARDTARTLTVSNTAHGLLFATGYPPWQAREALGLPVAKLRAHGFVKQYQEPNTAYSLGNAPYRAWLRRGAHHS